MAAGPPVARTGRQDEEEPTSTTLRQRSRGVGLRVQTGRSEGVGDGPRKPAPRLPSSVHGRERCLCQLQAKGGLLHLQRSEPLLSGLQPRSGKGKSPASAIALAVTSTLGTKCRSKDAAVGRVSGRGGRQAPGPVSVTLLHTQPRPAHPGAPTPRQLGPGDLLTLTFERRRSGGPERKNHFSFHGLMYAEGTCESCYVLGTCGRGGHSGGWSRNSVCVRWEKPTRQRTRGQAQAETGLTRRGRASREVRFRRPL